MSFYLIIQCCIVFFNGMGTEKAGFPDEKDIEYSGPYWYNGMRSNDDRERIQSNQTRRSYVEIHKMYGRGQGRYA